MIELRALAPCSGLSIGNGIDMLSERVGANQRKAKLKGEGKKRGNQSKFHPSSPVGQGTFSRPEAGYTGNSNSEFGDLCFGIFVWTKSSAPTAHVANLVSQPV